MKEIIDKVIEKHGRIIVSEYINPATKIEHRRTISRTNGGMYVLEDLTIDRSEGVHEDEHINTWDFEEVKSWCMESIIFQKLNEQI